MVMITSWIKESCVFQYQRFWPPSPFLLRQQIATLSLFIIELHHIYWWVGVSKKEEFESKN